MSHIMGAFMSNKTIYFAGKYWCQTCKSLKEGNRLSSDFTFLLQGWQVMAKAIMMIQM